MKIRFYSMLIVAILVICTLIGCGKKELDNGITGNITQKEEIVSETPAPTEIPEPVVFECMDKIKTAAPEDGLVQVDDMLFQYGCKFSEILQQVEASECQYIISEEISGDALVLKNSSEGIYFYKNEKLYFTIVVENPTNATIMLKDCIVRQITVYSNAKGNSFYSGIYTENDEPVTYFYAKEKMKNYELISEKDSYEGDERKIDVSYVASSNISPSGKLYIYLIFESTTSELRSFLISFTSQMQLP